MSVSIKTNFFYSSILTAANYIFPFLTYPYVSRVLGVENIGACNFVDAIINYFLLLSFMGIRQVGIREIAKSNNNKTKLNEVYSSLLVINSITTFVAVLLLFIITINTPQLMMHKEMMMLGGLRILFSYLQVEWLFNGLEDFKYITIRTIIIRSLYVLSVFVFVRKPEDYIIYFALSSGVVLLNVLINQRYARSFVKFSLNNIQLRPLVKPFFILGIYGILTSMYTSFNVAFLGFASGETEVGYYTTATKLYGILLSIFTAFTGVMLPRMSSLLSENKFDEFKKLTTKSFKILITYAMPITVLSIVMAPCIIRIISGEGYEGAIIPMRIVMPLLIIIGLEQVLVLQILSPLGADKVILRNSIIGALVGLLLNFLLVPLLSSIGSAIVWATSEFFVLIFAQIGVYQRIQLIVPYKYIAKNLFMYIPLMIFLIVINSSVGNIYFELVIGMAITMLYSAFVNVVIIKDSDVLSLIPKFKK